MKLYLRPQLLAGIATAAVLAACTDDPAAPVAAVSGAPGYQFTTNIAAQSEFDHRPSFELDVQAVGSFKPGHPVHLTFTASAVTPVADGELRVTLPEVISAEESGWDVVVIPTGEVLRPHLQVRRAFAEGERVREQLTLTIPEPGYYLVAATGYRHRSEAEPGKLSDVSRRDYWLWISEHGGKLTTELDTTVFSPDDRKQRGPRGSLRRASRLRSADASIECTLMPDGGEIVIQSSPCPQDPNIGITPPPPPPPPSATHTFRVLYDKSSYGISQRPVPGARYIWSITSVSTNGVVSSGNGVVGADGSIPTIDCQGPTTDRRISLTVYTLNEKAIIRYQNSERGGGVSTSCGGPTNVYLDPEMAHLFLNTVKIYDGHRLRFPFPTVPRIEAGLYDDGKTYYHHNSTNGELHMAKLPQMIYGEDGVMFVTHEYGHHYQDRYLFTSPDQNGLMRFTSGCATQHPPESMSNFGCALGEGFADWYAVVVRETELPDWKWRTEDNWFYRNCINGYTSSRGQVTCTTDGSIVQGAVTAMLWDMIDAGWSESHDVIQRRPEDVAQGLKSCRVRVGTSWLGHNGIDHFIYCMENRLPYSVTVRSPTTGRDTVLALFTTRAANQRPNDNSGTRLLASDATAYRRLWLVNLYSKHPQVGTSPTLSSLEPAPTPPPPGDGGGGGGGDCGADCPIIH